MAVWLKIFTFPRSQGSTMLRPLNQILLLRGRTPLTSAGAGVCVRRMSNLSGFTSACFTRWKRLLPPAVRYARRCVTTPSRPPSRYLLFGVAGFLWERERISNEEVLRCLKQYEERVKLQGNSHGTNHQSESQQPLYHGKEDYSQNSLLPASSSSSDSWRFGSIWSTLTFGMFGSNQEQHESSNSEILHDTKKSLPDELMPMGVKIATDDTNNIVDEKQQRRIQFVQELSQHLHSHSELRIAELPLVGLSPRGPSGISFGSKFVKKVKDMKYRVVKRVLEASKVEVEGQEVSETEHKDCCGSKIADLACLEMESHDHTCVSDANKEGDWFQFKVFELNRDLYTLSGDQSELSYHFYPMVGLQEHKVTNRITSLTQGSPLATILQSIEQLSHAYDNILGTDYHMDSSLVAHSTLVKTRMKHILSGVVNEISNEIKELKHFAAASFNEQSVDDHKTGSSTMSPQASPAPLRGGAYMTREGVATTDSGPVGSRVHTHVQEAKEISRFQGRLEISEPQINSFHHFSDVHLACDEGDGPPVSRQLGRELLSMLKMARSKVKLDRQQTEHRSLGSSSTTNSSTSVNSREAERGDSERSVVSVEESQEQTATLEGWELLVNENSNIVYRRLYQDTGLYQYKVIGRYHDITAKDYLDVQVDHEARKTWDTYAVTLDTVDSDPRSNCELIYWVMKYPFPLSSREYVFVRKVWISPEEDAIVFISRSVDHPEFPVGRKFTRVDQYFSEMVIKPDSFVDEPGFNYELTYLDNPQISLPSSVVNWVTTTAMPDFLTKIHQAAAAKTRKERNLFT